MKIIGKYKTDKKKCRSIEQLCFPGKLKKFFLSKILDQKYAK